MFSSINILYITHIKYLCFVELVIYILIVNN
uniref:Uncharacterized protein n=1 Tax=viral metagenome TaxID=1070528 RepID=A0A6C0EFI6_9ZZZZ